MRRRTQSRVVWPAVVLVAGVQTGSMLPARAADPPAPPAAPAPAARPGDAELAAASDLVKAGKFAEGEVALRKFLTDFPLHPQVSSARIRVAEALLGQKKVDEAAKAIDPLLTEKLEDPVRADALLALARVRSAQNQPDKAVGPLTEALKLTEYDEKRNPAIAMALGEILLKQEKFPEAAQAFYQVTRWPEDPLAPRAYFLVGESYRSAGNPLEAAIAYRNTAANHSDDPLAPRASLLAAGIFLDLGKLADAEGEYRRILEKQPRSEQAPRAQVGVGRVALARGNYSTARAAFQAAAVLFPNAGLGPETQLRVADAYLGEKNYEEARKRYATLVDAPDRLLAGEARYQMAQALLGANEVPGAVEQYQKLAHDQEAGRWSYLSRLRLAEIRTDGGDFGTAIATLRPILAMKGEPALVDEAAYRIAEILIRREDYEQAETELTTLLKRSPAGPFADLAAAQVARTRFGQKDPAGAASRAEVVLKGEPSPPARALAMLALGRAQLAQKKEAGATTLQELLERFPKDDAAPEAAQALLNYYQDTKQTERADAMEKFLAGRDGGVATAVTALLVDADRDLEAGKLAEARKGYSDALERRPDRASRLRAHAGLAEIAATEKRGEDLAEQTRLISGDAPSPLFLAKTQLRVARAHERAGEAEAARTAYQAALDSGADPEVTPAATVGISRLMADQGKSAEAAPLLRDVIAKYPKSSQLPEALYALAWASLDAGDSNAARPIFGRLARDFPNHPLAADATFRVGEMEYAAGKYAEAATRYRAAAASETPVADKAGYKLGWALRQSGDTAAAAAAFQDVVKRFPKSELAAESRVRAGEALLELNKGAEAQEQFGAVLEAAKDSEASPAISSDLVMQAKVGAARARLLAGEAAEARTLTEGLGVPGNGWYGARARLIRAEAILKLDGPKAAAPEFLRVATLFPKYRDLAAEAQFRAGESYDQLGNKNAAKAAWGRLVSLYAGTSWAERGREKLNGKPEDAASGDSG